MTTPPRRRCWLIAACGLLGTAALPAHAAPLDLHYTGANTGGPAQWLAEGLSVSADGQKLQLRTQPFGSRTGGVLNFGQYPWWVTVASYDQGQGLSTVGDRYRGQGTPRSGSGQRVTIATLVPGSTQLYRLRPVALSGIIRGVPGATWSGQLQGTITTDGSRGAIGTAQLQDMDLHVIGTQP